MTPLSSVEQVCQEKIDEFNCKLLPRCKFLTIKLFTISLFNSCYKKSMPFFDGRHRGLETLYMAALQAEKLASWLMAGGRWRMSRPFRLKAIAADHIQLSNLRPPSTGGFSL